MSRAILALVALFALVAAAPVDDNAAVTQQQCHDAYASPPPEVPHAQAGRARLEQECRNRGWWQQEG